MRLKYVKETKIGKLKKPDDCTIEEIIESIKQERNEKLRNQQNSTEQA